MTTSKSILNHEIRLPNERWAHIVESHDYMAGYKDVVIETLTQPDKLIRASTGEHYALRYYASTHLGSKTCVVVYRDEPNGFVITALMTSKPQQFTKRGDTIWKK